MANPCPSPFTTNKLTKPKWFLPNSLIWLSRKNDCLPNLLLTILAGHTPLSNVQMSPSPIDISTWKTGYFNFGQQRNSHMFKIKADFDCYSAKRNKMAKLVPAARTDRPARQLISGARISCLD
jgi:hypothetical protein